MKDSIFMITKNNITAFVIGVTVTTTILALAVLIAHSGK
jgi:hypothetical protein